MTREPGKGIDIGIDLGTSNLLVYVDGEGIVFNQPSIIAIDKESGKVVSIGTEAHELLGKEHEKVEVIRPMAGGVIADIDMIRAILEFTLIRIRQTRKESINKLLICVPSELTETEKDAIELLANNLLDSGIAVTEEEVKAAALGSGVNIFEPSGKMIIDIGGGTTDIGVLSLGHIVLSKSIKIAGEYIDKQIVRYVKEKHGLEIGAATAEKIKIKLATLIDFGDERDDEEYKAAGRDLVEGLPKEITIKRSEIKELVLESFESIKTLIRSTLEVTPPELAGDLCDAGIVVAGGGALIPGIKEYIEKVAEVEVRVSKNPLNAVVEGTKRLLKISENAYLGEYDS